MSKAKSSYSNRSSILNFIEAPETSDTNNKVPYKKPVVTEKKAVESISIFRNRNFFSKPNALKVLVFLFRILGVTFFFLLFEIAFFILLYRIGNLFYELWLLQISVISGYIIFILSTIFIKTSRISKLFKIITSFLMLILIIGLLIIIWIFAELLITLNVILILLAIYYTFNLLTTFRIKVSKGHKKKRKSFLIISIIFLASTGVTTIFTILPNSIEIDPKTEPELIFWCGSSQIPEDPETLELCKKYNIGFMPTIRSNMIGNDEYIQLYKNILDYGINLHFCIGGDSGFFANIDNAGEFHGIYLNIKEWFCNESIFDNPHIVSFSIDAEPPKNYEDYMNKDDILSSINYGYNNYPSEKEINEATKSMEIFTELVKNDGKECGMIRIAQMLDSSDDDGDLSLFTRNLYSLDLIWDYTITMLYRTNRLQSDDDDTEPPSYLAYSLPLMFGAIIEGTKFTNSELNFYQNIALIQNDGDTNAKKRFVFIGNFKKEFEDTQYIKKEQYKKDLDICRHFRAERIFFYDLKGFLSHYGREGIEELGIYNQHKKKWNLEYNNSRSISFMLFYCGLIIIDLFSFFEKDIS